MTLVLRLQRQIYTERSTIGELTIDGNHVCHTLEDYVRALGEFKVPGKTAIPSGSYEVIINHSERFQCLMPLLLEVPGFKGVRIHAGNTDADTQGCILVGRKRGADRILESRLAYEDVFQRISDAAPLGEVWIEIIDSPEAMVCR